PATKDVVVMSNRVTGELESESTAGRLRKEGGDLGSCQVSAETEVHSPPEAEVVVRRPVDHEVVWILKDFRIPVSGGEPQDHLVAGNDLLVPDCHGLESSASHRGDRGHPSEDLLRGRRQKLRILD